MNIYEKMNMVKLELLAKDLQKSGKNSYAGFQYYELKDITPAIIDLCQENKLFTQISFGAMATLSITDMEKPDDKLIYESPIVELELKGCNKIQALGGAQTYLRRYLYLVAFDIVEPDLLDKVAGKQPKETKEPEMNYQVAQKWLKQQVDKGFKLDKPLEKHTLSEIREIYKEIDEVRKET
jgi:hypothetical protein